MKTLPACQSGDRLGLRSWRNLYDELLLAGAAEATDRFGDARPIVLAQAGAC